MNIVFDFGGVLFQWRPAALLARLLPHRASDGASAAALADRFFQGYGGDWMEFDRGTVDVPTLVGRIASRTGLEPSEVQAVVDAVPAELQPVPATVALLQRLRDAGHRVFFLSNMPAGYADHLEAAHPVVGWFEAGVFSSRVRLVKPEPAIYALAESRFGVAGATLVFLDDHLPNVEAARAAGWSAFHFTDAAAAEAAMRAHGIRF